MNRAVMTELVCYLGDTDYTSSPLDYWKKKQNDCLILSRIALVHLLKMGSFASAERLFSGAFDIEKRKQWHMIETTLEGYVLCKCGYKNKLINL